MTKVRIAINPHWYSKFWIQQFYGLWRKGQIHLRPLVTKKSPPMCFFFTVNDQPYLIDVSDHKTLQESPASYTLYFKANYSSQQGYPDNVRPSVNGTTLTRANVPQGLDTDYPYDIVWVTGIGGGRPHKVALFEAIAALPLKTKLVARMISSEDYARWGDPLRMAGVELWRDNVPYREWLEMNKQGRWCVLGRGKHDCLSFKMIDYCSIGAAVMADYPPTSQWDVPVQKGVNFLSFDVSGPLHNDLSDSEFAALRKEYREKVSAMLPQLTDPHVRRRIAAANTQFFTDHIQNGKSAARILATVLEYQRDAVAAT